MYVKRYVVQRGRGQYVYLRLVEAYRDEQGKVRHRVVASLGREDQLKASGQLDQLAAAFTRLDPPTAGTRREVGPLLLVAHYLDRLGLVDLVDRRLSQRGQMGKLAVDIPYAGYATRWLAKPEVRTGVVIVGALLALLIILRRIWRDEPVETAGSRTKHRRRAAVRSAS